MSRSYAQEQTIKIGFLGPLSGGMEVMGRPLLTGAEIAVNQINKAGGVNGMKLELVPRDDKGTGKDAVTGARDLFASGVNLLCGNISTASVLGVSPLLSEANATLISCSAVADSLTHEDFTPNYFRICENAYTKYRAQARLFAERHPDMTNWTGVVTDAANGRSIWTAFEHGLREFYPALANKEVSITDPVVTKVGASDFKQQIVRLMSSPAQCFLNTTNGADAILFFSQAASLGLDSKFPLVTDAGSGWGVPLALKDKIPQSILTGVFWYYEAYDHLEMGRELYKDYVDATGKEFPDDFVELSHAAVYAYANAIKATGNTDTQQIVKAMEGMKFQTAKGEREFRKEDHQCIGDVTFLTLDRADNERGWKVGEFIRVNGRDSMEPPSPGKAIDFSKI
ncbi:amino acid ABC substrate-binding protein [Nitratireductor aestuarii]|uniref:Amino acid ABC substrate-binding protein n=1 Tax=Nitratireductor aestuarii TaxID=1735103 RepID=A0A916S1E8_9HYPH|nr:ABC transporter substrate-binding protein [Nitratireductor aestuarii]GGA79071.1 amino acid ABC substrate-binding protein [Nitratireductor aestuarii]